MAPMKKGAEDTGAPQNATIPNLIHNPQLHEKVLNFIRRDSDNKKKAKEKDKAKITESATSLTPQLSTPRQQSVNEEKFFVAKQSESTPKLAASSPIQQQGLPTRSPKNLAPVTSPEQGKTNTCKLGFPVILPLSLIEVATVRTRFDSNEKKAGVVVSKSMLVLRVEEYSIFHSHLKICDFLTRIDDIPICGKREFFEILKTYRKSGKEFKIRVERPVWNSPATRLPKGYDRVPGYDYIRGIMILYPGGNLGMNVKSYNNKVYVTNTDQLSMSAAALLMGDCIVDIDGTPVTSTATCGERIITALKEKKFVFMTIERAVDPQALKVVKYILLVEKIPEKDPRMARDTTKIGCGEAAKIKSNSVVAPGPSIYRGHHFTLKRFHEILFNQKKTHNYYGLISWANRFQEMSVFTPIGADPFNPLLMQAVPPKKMDAMHAATKNATTQGTKIKDSALAEPYSSTSSNSTNQSGNK